MATSIKSTRRSVVTLNLPRAVPALISYAENIVKRMTGNSSFATPAPALSAVTAAIDDLRAAAAAAISRLKGAAAARNGESDDKIVRRLAHVPDALLTRSGRDASPSISNRR